MIVLNVFQVGTVLFEQDQQVRVVAYQMFRYPRVRLTEIEAVDVRVAIQSTLEKYSLIASCLLHATSSKIKIEFGRASLGETTSLLLENVK